MTPVERQIKAKHICTDDVFVTGDVRRSVLSAEVRGGRVSLVCADGSTPLLAADATILVERPDPRECRYRVVDEQPYLDREEEFDNLTLDEAAARIEDVFPVEAAQVINDVEEGVDWPCRYTDDETGREVTLTRTVS